MVGIAAAVGGGIEAAHEFNVDAAARALFITTKTCILQYDTPYVPPSNEGPQMHLIDVGTDGTAVRPAAFSVSRPSSPGGPWVVTKQTLNCLEAGAGIPGGAAVDTSDLETGEPERLLRGYAELEKSRGENFDASSTILGALFGAAVGGALAAWRRRKEAKQAVNQAAAG